MQAGAGKQHSTARVGPLVAAACAAFMLAPASFAIGQDAREVSAPGFEMAPPPGWHPVDRLDLVENIGRIHVSPEELKALMADFSRAAVVASYMKYQPGGHYGLIPKVQVDLIRHTTKTFEHFRSSIVGNIDRLKKLLDEFELTEAPSVVVLDGRQAVLLRVTFRVPGPEGASLRARSRIYAVPIGDTFFQINLSDGPDDDCAAMFDQLVSTIRFR
jgi:hypothetical protein